MRTTTSGGPGGQHANRAQTRVEVSLNVATSVAFGPRQRERVIERLGEVVRAGAADSRSQTRNRELALERLTAKLAAALRIDPPRTATRPSARAKARRVEEKRRQGQRKAQRRPPVED